MAYTYLEHRAPTPGAKPYICVLGEDGCIWFCASGTSRIGRLDMMQPLFALTTRALLVIRMLADGQSIESLAHSMGISANTVRTHLRAIFSKTCTTRQSELMQLSAGLAKA